MAGNTATWAGDFFAPFPEEVHSRFSRDFPNINTLRLMFRDAEKYGMEVGELRLTEISQDELAADIYLIAKLIDSLIKAEAEAEALRAEVERLQEIVRPKREDECLTLDHWRMRAYALEANWSRCSHACAVEQDKREQAEARAERLAEALAGLITWIPSADTYRRLGFDPEAPMRALEKARAVLQMEDSND